MKRPARLLLVPILLFLALSAARASRAEADALFNDQKWAEAAEAYRGLLEGDASDGQIWLRMGVALRRAGKPQAALEALVEAEKTGVSGANLQASLALTHAALDQPEKALSRLRRAAEAGIPVSFLENNPQLQELRTQEGFREVLQIARRRANPCLHQERYSAFDFWVGEWDVYSGGRQVGTNIIEKILEGCLIFENWTNMRGVAGKSFNYYDPKSGTWRQNWVSENGGIVRYEGSVRDGVMHYEGESIKPDGSVELARVKLEPTAGGNVHHLIEHSRDGGETWFNWFEAVYVPRGASPPSTPEEDPE